MTRTLKFVAIGGAILIVLLTACVSEVPNTPAPAAAIPAASISTATATTSPDATATPTSEPPALTPTSEPTLTPTPTPDAATAPVAETTTPTPMATAALVSTPTPTRIPPCGRTEGDYIREMYVTLEEAVTNSTIVVVGKLVGKEERKVSAGNVGM